MKRFAPLLALLLLGACSNDENHPWLGYAEGDTAFVSAPEAGWVSRVTVNRGDWVTRGELLFTLDDTHQAAARDQARATIALADAQIGQAEANLTYTQSEFQRQSGLMIAHAGTKQAYDLAKSNYDQAARQVAAIHAQRAQGEATLADASYQLSQRDVTSLTTGRVQDVLFRAGEYAPAMTPIISILPPENVYVRFFVPEKEFARVKLGQRIAISCDSCAPNLTATITFIAAQEEFTPPVIFSEENRDKLVFKVEARTPGGLKLNPGQPVDVRPL